MHRKFTKALTNSLPIVKSLLGVSLAVGALLLSGCATQQKVSNYFQPYQLNAAPKLSKFEVCISMGCTKRTTLTLSEAEQAQIKSQFEPAPATAEDEREDISQAVALLERINGPKAETQFDAPGNSGIFSGNHQLDCVAETLNTSVALMLMDQMGLLHFNRPAYPAHRGLLQLLGPHNAATIEDVATHQRYVVDSWFYANGVPATVVTLESWHDGFYPDIDHPPAVVSHGIEEEGSASQSAMLGSQSEAVNADSQTSAPSTSLPAGSVSSAAAAGPVLQAQ
ncbi:hypothetical protein ACKC9G_10780 [Pokkaliibacter sp. CJK22405]|uniref:hypothetical protein n=1 Tax=Pokkaliibacter sp. CJK22405 TaxID=3384615 RepID=UPI00398499B0